jgi:hypothetical protein
MFIIPERIVNEWFAIISVENIKELLISLI